MSINDDLDDDLFEPPPAATDDPPASANGKSRKPHDDPPAAENGSANGKARKSRGGKEKIHEDVRDAPDGFEQAVLEALLRRRVSDEAEIRRRAELAAEPPGPIGLRAFLAAPDREDRWWIDGLLPKDSHNLLWAPQKAGKTTLVGNLVRTLADGGDFLGRFATTPARIVLVDTESGDDLLRRWLRAQRIASLDAVTVVSLRGRESSLDVAERKSREHWRGVFAGADVVILDVAGPVLAALGLNESANEDVAPWWTGWRSLLTEAEVSSSLIGHHAGHNEERAIGASSWLRFPDVIWGITREDDDPTSPRYFAAYGRLDEHIPAGQLLYDPATRGLTFTGQRKTEAMASRHTGLLVAWLHDAGRQSASACADYLHDSHRVPQKIARGVAAQGVRDGVLRRSPKRPGDGSTAKYYEIMTVCQGEAFGPEPPE